MSDVLKEKIEFYKKEFRTGEGIWDFLLGSLIWGFVIVSYVSPIYGFITNNILSFIPAGFVRNYLGYLVFGFASWMLGLGITFVLIKLYRIIFKKR